MTFARISVLVISVTTRQVIQKKLFMAKIRVFLIEDNRILRDGITEMINAQKDVTVAAVSDGKDNFHSKVRTSKAEIVLVNLGLENQNSLEVVQTLKKEMNDLKIVGMGINPTQSDIIEFVQAGVEGFIIKNATLEEVVNTIRAITRGEKVLPTLMTESLFFQVAEHAILKGKKNLKNTVRMTQREKEVIALIVEGMSNKQIGDNLNIATFTVKSHVHNILEKLALNSRLQIAMHARDEK